jgi:UDP-N-acetylmuramoyl-L-alanyl-D-glutamate--2,6-diaminopimelate ligase
MINLRENREQKPRLSSLLRGMKPERIVHEGDPVITGLASDSRDVHPGSLFVAIPGTRVDGHDYIMNAVRAGASAIVCERLPRRTPCLPVVVVSDARRAVSMLADRFYGHPSDLLRVTGVTGTDGKTSTTEILRHILTEAGHPAGSVGTLGSQFDGRHLDSNMTTPPPISLHSTFRTMWESGMSDVCMEVSSHSLVQHRVADVDFDVAILTNITHDHLDFHGTREAYAAAKRMLFEQLDHDAVGVLPARSEFREEFQAACRGPVLTYAIDDLADVTGWIETRSMHGMRIRIRTPFEEFSVQTGLTGDYNCENVLAATTAAFALGVDADAVHDALRGFRGVPGRLERIRLPGRPDLPAVCVDFAHTSGALAKVLGTVRPLVEGRLVCLVGCGGDRDVTKRPEMGKIATDIADVSVFTADNSRSERTEDIIDQMIAGVTRTDREAYYVEPDRRKAIRRAIDLAGGPRSMVVICGRGCEKYLKIAGTRIPFDDRVVTRQIMTEIPLRKRKIA